MTSKNLTTLTWQVGKKLNAVLILLLPVLNLDCFSCRESHGSWLLAD